jgi:hypothetical protein
MANIAAGSGGKSSESSIKYLTFHGALTGVMFAWQLDGYVYFNINECTTITLLSVNVQSPIWQSARWVSSPLFNWVHWQGSSTLLARVLGFKERMF